MSPGERAEAEARADRLIRRGEMAEAVAVLRGLLQQFPDDQALAQRLMDLAETLQPSELQHPKARAASSSNDDPTGTGPARGTPEQAGERLFALGDHAGAMAAYRQALQQRPDSELVRERLEEIFRVAQSAPPTRPVSLPPRPQVASRGSAEALLKSLLERVAARRRV